MSLPRPNRRLLRASAAASHGAAPIRLSGALVLALGLALACLAPSSAAAQADGDALCASPRAAISTWIENLQPDTKKPAVAITCFDFSAGPLSAANRKQRARNLLSVLDGQGHYVIYGDIPDEPDYVDPVTSKAEYTPFALLPQVYLEKDDGQWKISAASVAATPDLYKATYRIPLDRFAQSLPAPFHGTVFGIENWRFGALFALVFLSILVARLGEMLVRGFFNRALSRFLASWDQQFADVMLRRTTWLVTAASISIFLPNIGLPVRVNLVLFVFVKAMASIAAILLLGAAADLGFDAWARRASHTDTKMDDQLIPLLRRGTKLLLYVVGALFVLQNMNVNVASLVAGVGLGGLAFALAAQDAIANLFGSLTIFADRPFQIGDWVVVDGVEGTVEEVGFRSTRVRTFYDSVVTIPNSKVANSVVDNMGQRRHRRFKTMLSLTYDTSPEKMTEFVEAVRATILASPHTRKEGFEIHFNAMGPHSLDVLVYCFFEVADWTSELQGKQGLMLQWMHAAKRVGVEFAFPTQTLHLQGVAPQAELLPASQPPVS